MIAFVGSLLIVTAPPLSFGLCYMGLKGARGEKVEFRDVLKGFSFLLKSWVYVILLLVLAFIPFVVLTAVVVVSAFSGALFLLALVGMVVVFAWLVVLLVLQMYAVPVIISKNAGVLQGLKTSIRLVKNNLASSVLLFMAVVVTNVVLGFIPFAGMLAGQPLTTIVLSKAMLELDKK